MSHLIAFVLAVLSTFILTRLVRDFATRSGFVDRPDGGRKAHGRAVALGGGVAVFTGWIVAATIGLFVDYQSGNLALDAGRTSLIGGLFIASFIIVLVGLVDDVVGLRGHYKLLGQIVAAGVLIWYSGLWIEGFKIGGFKFGEEGIPLGWWSSLGLTMFWLLGAINAINLIDGIDGLASSVGLVLSLTVAAITATQGHHVNTIVLLALAGALLAFLRYNFAPATIFLGDAGSMLVGLLIGAVAIDSSAKSAATVALTVPFAVWSIPILDSAAAILRRTLTGRSVFAADRGHLHHSLLTRGWTVRQAVLFIGLICLTTCVAAFLSFQFQDELIALVTVAAVGLFLIITKTFGHVEFALVKDRFRLAFGREGEAGNRESRIQLQGTREWDELWQAILKLPEDFELSRIQFSIHIASLNEDYFATWDGSAADKGECWRVTAPLVVDGEPVGKIDIAGHPGQGPTVEQIVQLMSYLEPLENDIRQAVTEIRQGRQQGATPSGSPDASPAHTKDVIATS